MPLILFDASKLPIAVVHRPNDDFDDDMIQKLLDRPDVDAAELVDIRTITGPPWNAKSANTLPVPKGTLSPEQRRKEALTRLTDLDDKTADPNASNDDHITYMRQREELLTLFRA